MRKCFLLAAFFIFAEMKIAYADEDPCYNDIEVLNITNRPSRTDSICTVPYKKTMIEIGYTYYNLVSGEGHNQNFPQLTLRFGLPHHYELTFILPSYNVQSTYPKTGYDLTQLEVKNYLGAYGDWLFAWEGLITLPTGSAPFGSANYGVEVNGLASYSLTSAFAIQGMLGATTQTLPHEQGGARYNSINANILFSYTFNNKVEFYGEIFGQTNAGPHLGPGINTDVGILYLLNHNWEVDVSAGSRLYGELGGYNNYAAIGTGVLF